MIQGNAMVAGLPQSDNAMAEPTQYRPGDRESSNIQDRNIPIRPEFGPMSLEALVELYNGHGAKERTPENLNKMREILYELERRSAVQLKQRAMPVQPSGPSPLPGPR